MKRRRLLAAGCAHCAALAAWPAAQASEWIAPPRFSKPELSSDEGGLWALMDREEKRLRRSPFVIKDAALQDYLQGIACKIGGEHCPDVRVYPVRTPFFNASMAPNGMMQIWTGLLLRVENEAQLAAVIGHEMGHYLQRHTLERLKDVKARSAFSTFVSLLGVVGALGQMAALAGAFAFSREHEREADAIGLSLMQKAGYDPREAPKIWAHLQQEMEAAPGGDPSRHSPMLASHPSSQERSQTLTRLSEPFSGGAVGAVEYGQRIAGFQFQWLEDELKRGQHGETLVLLNRMVNAQPHRSDLLYFRGELRRLRNAERDHDLALADLAKACELGSEPAQVHRAIGYIHLGRGDTPQAKAAFSAYLDRAQQATDADLIRQYLL